MVSVSLSSLKEGARQKITPKYSDDWNLDSKDWKDSEEDSYSPGRFWFSNASQNSRCGGLKLWLACRKLELNDRNDSDLQQDQPPSWWSRRTLSMLLSWLVFTHRVWIFWIFNDNGVDAALDDLERQHLLFFMEDEIASYCALTTEPPSNPVNYDLILKGNP